MKFRTFTCKHCNRQWEKVKYSHGLDKPYQDCPWCTNTVYEDQGGDE